MLKLESVRTLLKITHLTSSKSYLVIIHQVKLESVQTLLKVTLQASWKSYFGHYLPPIYMKSGPKSKFGSNMAQNHSFGFQYKVISGHYWLETINASNTICEQMTICEALIGSLSSSCLSVTC